MSYVSVDINEAVRKECLRRGYSMKNRHGKFTVCDFRRPAEDSAVVAFENVACLSGGGAVIEYLVKPDNSVEFRKRVVSFVS